MRNTDTNRGKRRGRDNRGRRRRGREFNNCCKIKKMISSKSNPTKTASWQEQSTLKTPGSESNPNRNIDVIRYPRFFFFFKTHKKKTKTVSQLREYMLNPEMGNKVQIGMKIKENHSTCT